MNKSYVDYISRNGIYYHHTISTTPSKDRRGGSKPESHKRIEILFLISGKVDYYIDGSVYRISPGDLIVVNAQELHSLKVVGDIPYERLVLQFSPDLIPNANDMDLSYPFLNAYLYQHIIPKEIVNKSQTEAILRSILPLTKDADDKYKDVKIIAKVIDVIAEINKMTDTLMSSEYHLIPQPKSTNELLQAIIKFINENIAKNHSVKDIAKVFNISDSYLYRFFKIKMGITLHQYVNNQKLQYALSLLNQGYAPQYVSQYLGYDYYTTFYAQFRSKFGKSPKASVNKVHSITNTTPPPEKFKPNRITKKQSK